MGFFFKLFIVYNVFLFILLKMIYIYIFDIKYF